jgi:peptidoglycan/xylan/chitin deacetylase (PgdA/CDA1 family)
VGLPLRIALTSTLCCLPLWAQLPGVAVTPFQGDADGAVSYTFDDGSQNQSTIGSKLLEEQGFRGTFYLIAGYTRDVPGDPLDTRIPKSENWARVSWQEWIDMERRGHELGCHTLTHPRIANSGDSARFDREVSGAVEVQKQKTGHAPLTFAHPYNEQSALLDRIVLRNVVFFRTNWKLFGQANGPTTASAMNAVIDDATKKKGFTAVEIHGLDEPWAPTPSAAYREHLAYVRKASDEKKIWIATFWKYARYVKARDSTSVAVSERTPTRATFTASCRARAVVCDDSLTFSVSGAASALAKAWAVQDGKLLPISSKAGNLLVSAVPGRGPVTVDWSGAPAAIAPAPAKEIHIGGGQSIAVPQQLGAGPVELNLVDLRGRTAWKGMLSPGFDRSLKLAGVTPGLYVLRMRGIAASTSMRVLVGNP